MVGIGIGTRERHRHVLGRFSSARRFLEEADARSEGVRHRGGVPSLAQDALVLAIDPATGKIWNHARFTVPCALLVELAREGRLDVSGTGRKTRLALRDPTPLGDPELDEALNMIGSGIFGHKATCLADVVPRTDQLAERLVRDGVLEQEEHRRLGMFTVRRYRPTAAAGRDALVAQVGSAMLGESVPDERTALLISSLVDVHEKLIVPKGKGPAGRPVAGPGDRRGDPGGRTGHRLGRARGPEQQRQRHLGQLNRRRVASPCRLAWRFVAGEAPAVSVRA